MTSSFDEAIDIIAKYKEERCPVRFSISVRGFFSTGTGVVESVSRTKVEFSTPDGSVMILWDVFDPRDIEYFEPGELAPGDRPEEIEDLDSFWRFVSDGDGSCVGVFILAALKV